VPGDPAPGDPVPGDPVPGDPVPERDPGRSVVHLIDEQAATDPDRAALLVDEEVTTYGELATAAARCAVGLAAAGVRARARVPLADDTGLLSVATLLACPRIGAAAALMNPRLTTAELAVLLRTARTGPVGVAGAQAASALAAATQGPVLGHELVHGGDVTGAPGAAGTVGGFMPRPEDDAVVLFTSGTTGTPKAVPLTHGLLGPRVAAFAPPFDPRTPPAVSLMCVPLVHIGGMLGLLVALARGATTVAQRRFDAGEWLALVERHRVETCFVVPTMLHRILEHPDFATTDLSSLTLLSYGAAPASPDLLRRAMAALPHVSLSNVFGQTETLGSITMLGPDEHTTKLGSVGRPLPGVEVEVADPVTGDPVPSGSVGELWVRTRASVLPDPASVTGPSPGPGWLRTGDLVTQDDDGYLYPAGRLSDTINRGGEKFAPMEIETVLQSHPAVRDAAVAGVPDDEMGQRVGALVVRSAAVSPEELRVFCREHLAPFKLPERIRFVAAIPYNDVGKVSRRELAAMLVAAEGDDEHASPSATASP
jgi:acyl-CoA synthetase (AMP-forming)/AMP-acid ligase II